MRSRRLPRRPFHVDSPVCAALCWPSLLLRRRCPVHDRAAAEEARGTPGRCAIRAAKSGRVTATPVDSGAARLRSAAGTSCSRATPLRPGLHAPPPRRSSAVAGGLRHRGGAAPSRFPLLLATGHSRSARAPTLPPHRRRPATKSFRPERGPCILEGGRVPGHGVREGRPVLSPFDFSLCP